MTRDASRTKETAQGDHRCPVCVKDPLKKRIKAYRFSSFVFLFQ